ncbi:MAG: LacI family DNA-binding transcriptional regulator [Clostridia bacterium]|nr:LacI family DNA-binding transcriptional regulator [Clostridia bacterium]
MATIKDVAERAGVSVATVSRMMNKPDVVKPQTVKKIQKAMKELNYYPDVMARALQTKRSGIIGLIVPRISYGLFARIADAVEDACCQHGFRLMICHSEYEEQREMDMVALLKANKVDGMLICSYVGDPEKYNALDLPIVAIDREMERIPSVTCDNVTGGALAAQELIAAGCRHPLIVTYPVPAYMPLHGRLAGFQKTIAEAQLTCSQVEIDTFRPQAARELADFLRAHPEVDGFFMNGDHMAAQLTQQTRAEGLPLLDQLPVVSFDGLDLSGFLDMTTIAQPIEDMGRYAVEILLQKIEGKAVPIRSTLEVKCIRRGSTSNRSNH